MAQFAAKLESRVMDPEATFLMRDLDLAGIDVVVSHPLDYGIALGEPGCMIDLADWHVLGIGVAKDKAAARRLYGQATKTDDSQEVQVATERLRDFDRLEQLLEDDR